MSGDLATSGVLRVGVVEGPHAGVFFVAVNGGVPAGVTVDLAEALARELGVTLAPRVFPNSGECTDALEAGTVEVAFMPVDAERQARVAFGPAYYHLRSTYLVSGACGIIRMEDVDRPQVRVVGIANTTTIRAAGRMLRHTRPVAARSVEEAVAMIASGEADAFALSHDSLKPFAKMLPGSRILEGAIQATSICIAVAKDRPEALARVSAFMAAAKATGVVRAAFDRAGLQDEAVAG